jgi:hypothetical protein
MASHIHSLIYIIYSFICVFTLVSSTSVTQQRPEVGLNSHLNLTYHLPTNSTIRRRNLSAQSGVIGQSKRHNPLTRRQVDPTTGALHCDSGPCADGR